MKLRTQTLALAVGALTLALMPATANARRIYFLVGVRHVYRIGPDRDLDLAQREEIEKTYADGVASDEATYQQHVQNGADPAAEAQARDQDLELLAEDRDKSLGALFDVRDDLRARYPQFQIKGDGPYQVIGVDYHMHEDVMVFDDFCAYAPWPGYVVVGRPYGGWVYGTVYTPGVFLNLYVGWSGSFGLGIGVPLFWGGFVGHAGPVPFRAGVFAGPPAVWAHPGGYYHAVGIREGFIGAHGGFVRGAAPAFNHGGAPGGFNHGAAAAGHAAPGGWAHSTAGGYSHGTPGGYSHSTGGGYTHSGGFSHSDTTRSEGAGGGRSWGGSRGAAGGHSDSTFGGSRSDSNSRSSNSHSGGYSHSGSHSSSGSSHSHNGSHGSSHSHGGSDHDSKDHH